MSYVGLLKKGKIMESKKVIIDLDEYLMLTEQAKKITDVIQELAKHTSIKRKYEQVGDALDPLAGVECKEHIRVDKDALITFFNTMMDTKDLEVKIEFDNEGGMRC